MSEKWLGEPPRVVRVPVSPSEARRRAVSALEEDSRVSEVRVDEDGAVVATLRTTWAIRAGRVRVIFAETNRGTDVSANVRIPHGIVGFTNRKSDAIVSTLLRRVSE